MPSLKKGIEIMLARESATDDARKLVWEEGDDAQLRASSAVYLTITSALSSWKSRRESRMMSPWLIQTCHNSREWWGDAPGE